MAEGLLCRYMINLDPMKFRENHLIEKMEDVNEIGPVNLIKDFGELKRKIIYIDELIPDLFLDCGRYKEVQKYRW